MNLPLTSSLIISFYGNRGAFVSLVSALIFDIESIMYMWGWAASQIEADKLGVLVPEVGLAVFFTSFSLFLLKLAYRFFGIKYYSKPIRNSNCTVFHYSGITTGTLGVTFSLFWAISATPSLQSLESPMY